MSFDATRPHTPTKTQASDLRVHDIIVNATGVISEVRDLSWSDGQVMTCVRAWNGDDLVGRYHPDDEFVVLEPRPVPVMPGDAFGWPNCLGVRPGTGQLEAGF